MMATVYFLHLTQLFSGEKIIHKFSEVVNVCLFAVSYLFIRDTVLLCCPGWSAILCLLGSSNSFVSAF